MKRFKDYITEEDTDFGIKPSTVANKDKKPTNTSNKSMELGDGEIIKSKDEKETSDSSESEGLQLGKGKVIK